MAASSGDRCATVFVAASTVFSNAAIVLEESAASPSTLPAREIKLRRVCGCTNGYESGSEARMQDRRMAWMKGIIQRGMERGERRDYVFGWNSTWKANTPAAVMRCWFR